MIDLYSICMINQKKILFIYLLQVTDDAIEVVAEQLRQLQQLDLSWCPRISDAALEFIACDLADTLQTLVLDRYVILLFFFFISLLFFWEFFFSCEID